MDEVRFAETSFAWNDADRELTEKCESGDGEPAADLPVT
jgi:hypothetical protein